MNTRFCMNGLDDAKSGQVRLTHILKNKTKKNELIWIDHSLGFDRYFCRGGTEGQTDGLMEGHTLLAPARATKMKKSNRLTRRCWWWRKTLITSITRFTTSLVHVSKTSNLSTLVVHRGKKGNRQSPIGKNCRKKWSDRLMMRRKISSKINGGRRSLVSE